MPLCVGALVRFSRPVPSLLSHCSRVATPCCEKLRRRFPKGLEGKISRICLVYSRQNDRTRRDSIKCFPHYRSWLIDVTAPVSLQARTQVPGLSPHAQSSVQVHNILKSAFCAIKPACSKFFCCEGPSGFLMRSKKSNF